MFADEKRHPPSHSAPVGVLTGVRGKDTGELLMGIWLVLNLYTDPPERSSDWWARRPWAVAPMYGVSCPQGHVRCRQYKSLPRECVD